MLISSYIKWILQSTEVDYSNETGREEMRHKLQMLLWQSSLYNADTIYGEHKTCGLRPLIHCQEKCRKAVTGAVPFGSK